MARYGTLNGAQSAEICSAIYTLYRPAGWKDIFVTGNTAFKRMLVLANGLLPVPVGLINVP